MPLTAIQFTACLHTRLVGKLIILVQGSIEFDESGRLKGKKGQCQVGYYTNMQKYHHDIETKKKRAEQDIYKSLDNLGKES